MKKGRINAVSSYVLSYMITTSTEPLKVIEAMVKGAKELGFDQETRKEYVLTALCTVDSEFVLNILSEVEIKLSESTKINNH